MGSFFPTYVHLDIHRSGEKLLLRRIHVEYDVVIALVLYLFAQYRMVGKISLQQVNRLLFCGVLITAVLYFGRPVLVPLMFAMFFSMLFAPLCTRMEKKIKRGFSSFIAIIIILLVVVGIGALVYFQARQLATQWPLIEKRTKELVLKTQDYIAQKSNMSKQKQDEFVSKRSKQMVESSGQTIKNAFAGVFGSFATFALILVFTFLFLLQRDKYEAFFIQIAGGHTKPDETKRMLDEITNVAHGYLTGRLISISIFTILYTTGFSIVGLQSAFLLAFVGAVLTLIPYVGSILGGVLPVIYALVTGDSINTAIAVFCVVLIINIMDNYLIEPNVIGGEVQISAFWTILILLIGGTLWGIAGMVLFLPMLAVTKIIFDNIPDLKPYAFLVGDQREGRPSEQLLQKIKSLFGKKTS